MDRWLRSMAAAVVLAVAAGVVRGDGGDTEGVRERLVGAARESGRLRGKAVGFVAAERLGIEAVVPEDRGREDPRRFARASEVGAYVRVRPWSVAYGDWRSKAAAVAVAAAGVEAWPTGRDGPALRELLKDRNGAVRSLAVEALGALDDPEDVKRIGAMLGDGEEGAVVLGWSGQRSAQAWFEAGENPVVPERTWHWRAVGTYAREALRVMTGHRFDGKDPRGVTFAEWCKAHDLGRASLWYWQERLRREGRMPEGRRRAMHGETVKEIAGLPPDVRWKVFLLATASDGDTVEVTGPANPLLPEGVEAEMPAGRLKELVAGETGWTDVSDVEGGRALMLGRLARVVDEVTRGYGAPGVFKADLARAIEREAAGARWRAVLVSRLLAEGRGAYLEKALGEEKDHYAREMIAGELVRADLAGEWGFSEKVFREERCGPGEWGSDARTGILKALGEGPHTREKARRLEELVEDPRNEKLFTQANEAMGMDMYRYWAMRGVEAIAGGDVVPDEVEEGFKDAAKAGWALGELRKIARRVAEEVKESRAGHEDAARKRAG